MIYINKYQGYYTNNNVYRINRDTKNEYFIVDIEKKYNISIEDIIYLFKNAGIDGIEIFNSKHTLSDIKRYLTVAKREGLLISGGSDYHGEIMKPNVKLGRISKDGTEKQEHYEMTVISRCIARNNQLNQFTNEEKNEGESR